MNSFNGLLGSANLINNFNDSPVLSKAEDGQIAVMSDTGVHILLCDASPLLALQQSTLNIQISKISPTASSFLPALEASLKDSFQFEHYVEFTLDRTLSVVAKSRRRSNPDEMDHDRSKTADPESPKLRRDHRGPRVARWSPLRADPNGGCLLAILWYENRLTIHSDCAPNRLWQQVTDISELWKNKGQVHLRKFCAARKVSSSETKVNQQLQKLKDQCYFQASVAFAWAPLYSSSRKDDNPERHVNQEEPKKQSSVTPTSYPPSSRQSASFKCFTFLAVAFKSGHIVLWRVEFPAKDDSDFRVVEVLDCGGEVVSDLLFIRVNESLVYLCQGNLNGRVLLHSLRLNDGILNQQKQDDRPLELWSNVDRMTITELSWSAEQNLILAVKGQTVVTWCLDKLESGHPMVRSKNMPAISSDFSVQSILSVSDGLFVSGMDGVIYRVRFQDGHSQSGSVYQLSPIAVPWNTNDWRLNGISHSPNCVFLIVALSPAFNYCHLTLRKPSKVYWICLKSKDEISALVLYHEGCLQEVTDALAYLKSEWTSKQQWPDCISNFLNGRKQWDAYTAYQLKLLRYLLQVQLLSGKDVTNQQEKDDLMQYLAQIEETIIFRNIQKQMQLFQESLGAATNATDTELRSISVFHDWLRQKSVTMSDKRQVAEIAHHYPLQKEFCRICNSHIPFSSYEKETCHNGHTFTRCSQMLLLCQDSPYRVCSFCKMLALPKDSQELSGPSHCNLQSNECVYCDGKLI